jgi:molecular chaperone GrpE
MSKKIEIEESSIEPDPENTALPGNPEEGEEEFKVTDRRHWNAEDDDDVGTGEPLKPTIIDEFRTRTEAAEQKLQEYIEAFKQFRDEQSQVRKRLNRDVDRRVDQKFGEVVSELLETVDNLDLALDHARKSPGGDSLLNGIELARNQFLATLERAGVEKIETAGLAFDPNEAEALRVDPVESAEKDGTITETMRPGYRIREQLIRPARVAVGRLQRPD